MPRSVALVTDSTSLDAVRARSIAVVVVPLQVVIGTTAYDEGVEVEPETVAAALRSHTTVSTSRPAPESFLRIDGGTIVPLEKVRTSAKAISRLEELAVVAAGNRRVDVAVSHLADPKRAGSLADRLAERVPGLAELVVTEVGAVIGAHV